MLKILVCDSEPEKYDIEKIIDNSDFSDYKIINTSSLKEAYENIETETFDIMIIGYDSEKPYEGYQAIKFIKKYNIPCIFLSYLKHKGIFHEARKNNKTLCIPKNKIADNLTEVLYSVITNKKNPASGTGFLFPLLSVLMGIPDFERFIEENNSIIYKKSRFSDYNKSNFNKTNLKSIHFNKNLYKH